MSISFYSDLQPYEVWRHFGALNEIPRPSGQEQAACNYVRRTALEYGATSKTDERGNIVVQVPGTVTDCNPPVVAIQAHLDMVCEKRHGVVHDFAVDPIIPRLEGDLVYASGTTLGADNGIGVALALAVLTSEGLEHGPLELLFTVEEETGLYGALNLDPAMLSANLLINLDSEDPEELTVGCAGGSGTDIFLTLEREVVASEWSAQVLRVSGLQGGHSGVQIHEPLANAIKLLIGVLKEMQSAGEIRLVSLRGGNAHNAIPRDAEAVVVIAPENLDAVTEAFERSRQALLEKWAADEPDIKVESAAGNLATQPLTLASTRTTLDLLADLPHGVLMMSHDFEGKVETSCNLASVSLGEVDTELKIHVSVRSFKAGELRRTLDQIGSRSRLAGARNEERDGYPGWEPDPNSILLERASGVYMHTQKNEPVIQVVHAGLECGVLVARKPGLEAISFGPRIRGAHTPEEHVYIPTVEGSWKMLVGLLADLSHPTITET
jgi:dipeptidase D